MKKIPLTQGEYALVDDNDFDRVSKFKWNLWKQKGVSVMYAKRRHKNSTLFMHTFITGIKYQDHINRNGLDNRKANLRHLPKPKINTYNRGPQCTNQYGLKGVFKIKNSKKCGACIKINKKTIYLGCFTDPNEAAIAYDRAAKNLFGEFAYLNFP